MAAQVHGGASDVTAPAGHSRAPSLSPEALATLTLIVDHPGALDAAAIGQSLYMPRIRGTGDVLTARAAILAQGTRPVRTAVHSRTPIPTPPRERRPWSTDVAEILTALRRRGLIEGRRPPMLSEEWAELDEEWALLECDDKDRSGKLARMKLEHPEGAETKAKLLSKLILSAPSTVAEWVGTAPHGNVQRALAELVDLGFVIPPSRRWPTDAGIALVDEMGRA